jgi:serralysin
MRFMIHSKIFGALANAIYSMGLKQKIDPWVATAKDFVHLIDDIVLYQSIFAGIGTTFDASAFQIGLANATTDRIAYNTITGPLFYDANGNVAGGMTLFATITAGTVFDVGDFLMV